MGTGWASLLDRNTSQILAAQSNGRESSFLGRSCAALYHFIEHCQRQKGVFRAGESRSGAEVGPLLPFWAHLQESCSLGRLVAEK